MRSRSSPKLSMKLTHQTSVFLRTPLGSRTELLVIITPRALYTESELREVGREMRSQVRHMELLDPAR